MTWITRADAEMVPTMPTSSTVCPGAERVASGLAAPTGVGDRDGTVAGRTGVRTGAGVLALDGVAVLLVEDPPHAARVVVRTAAATSEVRLLCIDAD